MVGTAVARGITSDNSDVPGRGRTPIRAFGIPHVIAISLGALVVGGSLGERKRRARRLALSVSLRCPRSHAPKCDRIPPTPGHAVGCAGRIPFALPYPAVGKHAWMVPAEVYPWTPRPLEVGMASSASRSSAPPPPHHHHHQQEESGHPRSAHTRLPPRLGSPVHSHMLLSPGASVGGIRAE